MDNSWIPLIASISGGMLAVTGGLMSQLVINNKQNSVENKVRTANKLEEAGSLANQILKSGYSYRAGIAQMMLDTMDKESKEFGAQKIIESNIGVDIDYFLLLIKLYEPSLLKEAHRLAAAEKDIGKYTLGLLITAIATGSFDPLKEYGGETSQMYHNLESCFNIFMGSLQQKFSTYRLP